MDFAVSTMSVKNSIRSHVSCRSCPSLQVILPPVIRHLKNDLLPSQVAIPGPVWLFFLENSSLEELSHLHVPINCIVVAALLNKGVIELIEVYQPSDNFPLQRNILFIGKSDVMESANSHLETKRKRYIRNMSGSVLKVSVIHNPPLSLLANDDNTHKPTGFLPKVWETIGEILNFKTLYIPAEGNVFGAILENGSWSGMMGALLRNETDAALGLVATLQRNYFVDFCTPIIFTSYRVYIRDPGNVTVSWGNFILPFSPSLWIGTIICFLISSMILSVSEYLCKIKTDKSPYSLSLTESLFGMFAVFFCQQAHIPESPHATSRIVIFFMFLASIVLFGAYSGALVSQLTVKRSRNHFMSINDLFEDGSYAVGVISSSAMKLYFTPHQTPLLGNP